MRNSRKFDRHNSTLARCVIITCDIAWQVRAWPAADTHELFWADGPLRSDSSGSQNNEKSL
jgi:hypothetical protein